eukprot:gene2348-2570_t
MTTTTSQTTGKADQDHPPYLASAFFLSTIVATFLGRWSAGLFFSEKALSGRRNSSRVTFSSEALQAAAVASAGLALPRSDSEFSLGLNKSESVDRMLSELGEFCQAGQVVLQALRVASVGVAVVFLLPHFLPFPFSLEALWKRAR